MVALGVGWGGVVHGFSRGACMVAPGEGACVVALAGMHCCSMGHAWLLWGGVCMVVPGGHAWLLGGACMVALGGHAWLLLGGHVWDMMRYGDTVNKQAVRILLECILVITLSQFSTDVSTMFPNCCWC